MDDVIIAGAGPAGALSAYLLASRGARVTVVDRCRFPRPKLCGDTVNPGALALLDGHLPLRSLLAAGRPIDGMLLTGPGGVRVHGRYGRQRQGLAIAREVFDAWLLEAAVRAGARFREATTVVGAVLADEGGVGGVEVRAGGRGETLRARMTIGAEGRRSLLARTLGGGRLATRPRRWAVGQYFDEVEGLGAAGEMHVREGYYLGVSPAGDGRANACLVAPAGVPGGSWADPARLLADRLAADALLSTRFARARANGPARVMGPLAVQASHPGGPGVLLAGDAVGFVDPMTGDGIHLALQTAEEAVRVIGLVLEGQVTPRDAHAAYARAVARRLGRKRQFNRVLRGLVDSPRAVRAAAVAARLCPPAFEAVIRYAGDARGARP